MAIAGRDYILYVNDPNITPPWRAVAGQGDMTYAATASTTEVGNKLSSVKSVLTSSISIQLTLSAILIFGSLEQDLLEQAFFQRARIKLREYFEGNSIREYQVYVTSLNKNMPEEGAATWQINMTVDGTPLDL